MDMEDIEVAGAELNVQAVLNGYFEELDGIFSTEANLPMEELLQTAYGFDTDDFTPNSALELYEEYSTKAIQLYSHYDGSVEIENKSRAHVLLRKIKSSYTILIDLCTFRGSQFVFQMSAEDMISRFDIASSEKQESIQIVYDYMLQFAKKLNLRHRSGIVYSQKMTVDGHRTYAWQPAENIDGKGTDISEMKTFIAFGCQRKNSQSVFREWIVASTDKLASKLTQCWEPEFRPLTTTRAYIAFRDGLYNPIVDLFIEYKNCQEFGIPDDLCVCVFHDIEFKRAWYSDIAGIPKNPIHELPTPEFDKIMTTQRFDQVTMFWIMAQLGRALFWGKVFDAW